MRNWAGEDFVVLFAARRLLSSSRAEFKGRPNPVERCARANVATQTEAAPALSKVCAAARAVAPVVRMSSTSKMCCAVTFDGSETENAPRTLIRLWRGARPAWLPVARRRMSVLGASASRHCGWLCAKEFERLNGKRARLIESALRVLGAVQRHGDYEHFSGRFAGQLSDGAGQQAAELARGGVQAVVFESVDGLTHPAFVDAVARRREQMAAGRGGKRGKALKPWVLQAR
jgi:hypothetical protein